ncbi:MAG: DUF3108 domain-containing protein [Bacteroidales bacterium]|nr:DUF3108 domain-containing protein [Bacteroidales bacterium]
MPKYILLLLLSLSTFLLKAQNNQACDVKNNAFISGENLDYVITYNWAFVWTDVGGVKFKVSNDSIFGKDVYKLKGTGVTFSFYDWFFQVRDVYQSWVNPDNLLPVYYHRDVDEDGYIIDIKYRYDFDSLVAYSEVEKTRKPYFQDTVDIFPCTYDVVSAVYKARNIDFSKYKKDEVIPIKILLDNEIHDIFVRYSGKQVKKVRGVGKFKTIRFTVSLVAGDVFKEGDYLTVWVSDDENRIPVWIESPIIVGTIKARLVNYEGLKHPLKSMIKKY